MQQDGELSEEEWTKTVLIPRLRRLGFDKVEYTHGPREKGRDVVLREYDRFLLPRFYGVQVKVGKVHADKGGAELHTIVAQLKTAYEQPYRDAATGSEHFVSGVYLVVAGTITPEARERLSLHTGQWLHIVDSDQLALADQAAARISDSERARRLMMTSVELKSIVLPDLDQLVESVNAVPKTRVWNQPEVMFSVASIAAVWEIAVLEFDLDDLGTVHLLHKNLTTLNQFLSRLPIGQAAESVLPSVVELIRALPSIRERAERVLRIVYQAASTERPAPGTRLPSAPLSP